MKAWLLRIFGIMVLLGALGCGADTSVETPENPDKQPTANPSNTSTKATPLPATGKGK